MVSGTFLPILGMFLLGFSVWVDNRLLSALIPHPSRNPRISSLYVDVCLTQEHDRRTISMKRQQRGFGRWALSARTVV